MLLIFPPAAKACEPPAGIAKLNGALKKHGIECDLLDMNLEAQLYLLARPLAQRDRWTMRAVKNMPGNLAAFKKIDTYRLRDKYSRAVADLNRVMEMAGKERGVTAGLADYQDENLSPVRSADLLAAAENPERNIFYPYFKQRLTEKLSLHPDTQGLDGKKAQIVGFSLNYLSQALCGFSMIGFIKKEFPGVKIIIGGGLVTSWMKRPGWENVFGGLVDRMVAGPGERALLALLGIDAGERDPCRPDYGSLPRERYLAPGFVLPYSSSSGCYWNQCTFCPETAERHSYISVPVHHALEDLAALAEQTTPILVHFLDNAISPALLHALAAEPAGVPWYGFARITPDLTDPDYCRALRQSGCVMLKLGLESGDQDVLDRMRKGIDLAIASRVLKNLREAGIAAYVYLLFGAPEETVQSARKTLDFVVRHRDAINFLNLAIFNMPVCSAEAGQYETEQFYEGDLSLYTGFRHPRGWDRKQVRQFLESEFKRNSVISSILKNDPPIYTSNHAPFFLNQGNLPLR